MSGFLADKAVWRAGLPLRRMKGISAALAAHFPQGYLLAWRPFPLCDGNRPPVADIHAKAATGAAIGVQSIGHALPLEGYGLMGTDSNAGIATATASGLDGRRKKDRLRIAAPGQQPARGGKTLALHQTRNLKPLLQGRAEEVPHEGAAAEVAARGRRSGVKIGRHPARIEVRDLQCGHPPAGEQCIEPFQTALERQTADGQGARDAVIPANKETAHPLCVQPRQGGKPQRAQAGQPPLVTIPSRPFTGRKGGRGASPVSQGDRRGGYRDGLLGTGRRAEPAPLTARLVDAEPLVVDDPGPLGTGIDTLPAARDLQASMDTTVRGKSRTRVRLGEIRKARHHQPGPAPGAKGAGHSSGMADRPGLMRSSTSSAVGRGASSSRARISRSSSR